MPHPRRGELALYAGTASAYADMYLTQPLLPVLSNEFGVGPTRAGLTVSAVVLAIAATSSLYGPISDALGRRATMAAATALRAAATLACALAPSFGALLLLRAVQGALVPGMTAVSVAYAGDRYRPADLGRVVGGIIGASVVGGLSGRVLGGWIGARVGWQASFAVFGVVSLAAALALSRWLEPGPAPERAGWARATRGMLAHLGDRRLVGAFLVGAALFFGWTGIFTYLPYHLSAPPHGLSPGQVSGAYLVYAAGVLASPLAGRLSARVPPRRLIGIGLAVQAAGMVITLGRPLAAVVAGLLVMVLGTFTAQAVAPAFVNATAPAAKGGANALYVTFYYVGGTLGSILPGLAWQAGAWPAVVAVSVAAVGVALVSNAVLCRQGSTGAAREGPGAR